MALSREGEEEGDEGVAGLAGGWKWEKDGRKKVKSESGQGSILRETMIHFVWKGVKKKCISSLAGDV